MKIYKVRFMDSLGKEQAEFGFYETRKDAIKRAAEVQRYLKQDGILDIREITVHEDSEKVPELIAKGYYNLKE